MPIRLAPNWVGLEVDRGRGESNWGLMRGREELGIGLWKRRGVEFEGGSEMALREGEMFRCCCCLLVALMLLTQV